MKLATLFVLAACHHNASSVPDGAFAAEDVTSGGHVRRSAFEVGIYPQGERFGLVLVGSSIEDTAAMQEALASGWNVADSYDTVWWSSDVAFSLDFIAKAAGTAFCRGEDSARSTTSRDVTTPPM